jgi:hypothetical protein
MAMMSFLLRAAFWLIILVLLLPTDEKQQSQVYGTAEAAVKDVTSFCSRNPSVCAEGKNAFDVFVQKAQFGAQMIVGFVKEQAGLGQAQSPSAPEDPAQMLESPGPDAPAAGESENDGAETSAPGQVSQAQPPAWMPDPAAPEMSQSTLTDEDIAPAYSEPAR